MASTYTRQRVVDPAGGGTDTTIGAGITAAVAAGASWSTPWLVSVAPGLYVENVNVPTGIVLAGSGALTRIQGTLEVHPGTETRDLYVDLRTNPSSHAYALGLRFDGTENFYVHNVIAYCYKDHNGITAAVEASGTGTAIARLFGCYLYGANRITTTAANAKVVALRLKNDFSASDVEVFGSHFKTSAGLNGVSESILVLNEYTGGGAFGYAHIGACDWAGAYAGISPTPPAVLLDNANTTHPGGTLDVACWNPAGTVPIIRSAYSGTPTSANVGPIAHSRYSYRSAVEGGLIQRSGTADRPYH